MKLSQVTQQELKQYRHEYYLANKDNWKFYNKLQYQRRKLKLECIRQTIKNVINN